MGGWDDPQDVFWPVVVTVGIVALIAGVEIGRYDATRDWERQAVDHGAGEITDGEFRWKGEHDDR